MDPPFNRDSDDSDDSDEDTNYNVNSYYGDYVEIIGECINVDSESDDGSSSGRSSSSSCCDGLDDSEVLPQGIPDDISSVLNAKDNGESGDDDGSSLKKKIEDILKQSAIGRFASKSPTLGEKFEQCEITLDSDEDGSVIELNSPSQSESSETEEEEEEDEEEEDEEEEEDDEEEGEEEKKEEHKGEEEIEEEAATCLETPTPNSPVKTVTQVRLILPPIIGDNYQRNSATGQLFLNPSKISKVQVESSSTEISIDELSAVNELNDLNLKISVPKGANTQIKDKTESFTVHNSSDVGTTAVTYDLKMSQTSNALQSPEPSVITNLNSSIRSESPIIDQFSPAQKKSFESFSGEQSLFQFRDSVGDLTDESKSFLPVADCVSIPQQISSFRGGSPVLIDESIKNSDESHFNHIGESASRKHLCSEHLRSLKQNIDSSISGISSSSEKIVEFHPDPLVKIANFNPEHDSSSHENSVDEVTFIHEENELDCSIEIISVHENEVNSNSEGYGTENSSQNEKESNRNNLFEPRSFCQTRESVSNGRAISVYPLSVNECDDHVEPDCVAVSVDVIAEETIFETSQCVENVLTKVVQSVANEGHAINLEESNFSGELKDNICGDSVIQSHSNENESLSGARFDSNIEIFKDDLDACLKVSCIDKDMEETCITSTGICHSLIEGSDDWSVDDNNSEVENYEKRAISFSKPDISEVVNSTEASLEPSSDFLHAQENVFKCDIPRVPKESEPDSSSMEFSMQFSPQETRKINLRPRKNVDDRLEPMVTQISNSVQPTVRRCRKPLKEKINKVDIKTGSYVTGFLRKDKIQEIFENHNTAVNICSISETPSQKRSTREGCLVSQLDDDIHISKDNSKQGNAFSKNEIESVFEKLKLEPNKDSTDVSENTTKEIAKNFSSKIQSNLETCHRFFGDHDPKNIGSVDKKYRGVQEGQSICLLTSGKGPDVGIETDDVIKPVPSQLEGTFINNTLLPFHGPNNFDELCLINQREVPNHPFEEKEVSEVNKKNEIVQNSPKLRSEIYGETMGESEQRSRDKQKSIEYISTENTGFNENDSRLDYNFTPSSGKDEFIKLQAGSLLNKEPPQCVLEEVVISCLVESSISPKNEESDSHQEVSTQLKESSRKPSFEDTNQELPKKCDDLVDNPCPDDFSSTVQKSADDESSKQTRFDICQENSNDTSGREIVLGSLPNIDLHSSTETECEKHVNEECTKVPDLLQGGLGYCEEQVETNLEDVKLSSIDVFDSSPKLENSVSVGSEVDSSEPSDSKKGENNCGVIEGRGKHTEAKGSGSRRKRAYVGRMMTGTNNLLNSIPFPVMIPPSKTEPGGCNRVSSFRMPLENENVIGFELQKNSLELPSRKRSKLSKMKMRLKQCSSRSRKSKQVEPVRRSTRRFTCLSSAKNDDKFLSGLNECLKLPCKCKFEKEKVIPHDNESSKNTEVGVLVPQGKISFESSQLSKMTEKKEIKANRRKSKFADGLLGGGLLGSHDRIDFSTTEGEVANVERRLHKSDVKVSCGVEEKPCDIEKACIDVGRSICSLKTMCMTMLNISNLSEVKYNFNAENKDLRVSPGPLEEYTSVDNPQSRPVLPELGRENAPDVENKIGDPLIIEKDVSESNEYSPHEPLKNHSDFKQIEIKKIDSSRENLIENFPSSKKDFIIAKTDSGDSSESCITSEITKREEECASPTLGSAEVLEKSEYSIQTEAGDSSSSTDSKKKFDRPEIPGSIQTDGSLINAAEHNLFDSDVAQVVEEIISKVSNSPVFPDSAAVVPSTVCHIKNESGVTADLMPKIDPEEKSGSVDKIEKSEKTSGKINDPSSVGVKKKSKEKFDKHPSVKCEPLTSKNLVSTFKKHRVKFCHVPVWLVGKKDDPKVRLRLNPNRWVTVNDNGNILPSFVKGKRSKPGSSSNKLISSPDKISARFNNEKGQGIGAYSPTKRSYRGAVIINVEGRRRRLFGLKGRVFAQESNDSNQFADISPQKGEASDLEKKPEPTGDLKVTVSLFSALSLKKKVNCQVNAFDSKLKPAKEKSSRSWEASTLGEKRGKRALKNLSGKDQLSRKSAGLIVTKNIILSRSRREPTKASETTNLGKGRENVTTKHETPKGKSRRIIKASNKSEVNENENLGIQCKKQVELHTEDRILEPSSKMTIKNGIMKDPFKIPLMSEPNISYSFPREKEVEVANLSSRNEIFERHSSKASTSVASDSETSSVGVTTSLPDVRVSEEDESSQSILKLIDRRRNNSHDNLEKSILNSIKARPECSFPGPSLDDPFCSINHKGRSVHQGGSPFFDSRQLHSDGNPELNSDSSIFGRKEGQHFTSSTDQSSFLPVNPLNSFMNQFAGSSDYNTTCEMSTSGLPKNTESTSTSFGFFTQEDYDNFEKGAWGDIEPEGNISSLIGVVSKSRNLLQETEKELGEQLQDFQGTCPVIEKFDSWANEHSPQLTGYNPPTISSEAILKRSKVNSNQIESTTIPVTPLANLGFHGFENNCVCSPEEQKRFKCPSEKCQRGEFGKVDFLRALIEHRESEAVQRVILATNIPSLPSSPALSEIVEVTSEEVTQIEREVFLSKPPKVCIVDCVPTVTTLQIPYDVRVCTGERPNQKFMYCFSSDLVSEDVTQASVYLKLDGNTEGPDEVKLVRRMREPSEIYSTKLSSKDCLRTIDIEGESLKLGEPLTRPEERRLHYKKNYINACMEDSYNETSTYKIISTQGNVISREAGPSLTNATPVTGEGVIGEKRKSFSDKDYGVLPLKKRR